MNNAPLTRPFGAPSPARGEGDTRHFAQALPSPTRGEKGNPGNAHDEGARLLKRVLIIMTIKISVLGIGSLIFMRWKGLI